MGRIHRHLCSRQTQERMGKRTRRHMAEHRRVHVEPYREKKKRINTCGSPQETKAGAQESAGGNLPRTLENPRAKSEGKACEGTPVLVTV